MKTRCSERGLELEDWKKKNRCYQCSSNDIPMTAVCLFSYVPSLPLSCCQSTLFFHTLKANSSTFLITKSPGLKRLGLQGVVSYMSRVEVFVTGIKIESSDQSLFWELIKITSKLQKSKDQKRAAPIWPLTCKKPSSQEPLKGRSSDQAHILLIKILILVENASTGDI